MSWVRRREIPLIIFAVTFLISLLQYYLAVPFLSEVNTEMTNWVLIMSTFALGTGLIALCIYHGKIIMQKKSGYFVSIILFISMLMLFISYYAAPSFADYLYNEIYTPLSIAIICFTAFYNYTAIYRAFRVRNIDAAVFAFAAVFLMMLYAPIFEVILPQTATVANWILDVPNMGASRGVIIGVALGTIAIAVRVLLGYERAYTG
ncbi:MAG: hypothetical protein NDF57_05290 [archaeon GBS-70-058]|nr:hypothetical protein [Candidatus Culexarchaeum nevadense]